MRYFLLIMVAVMGASCSQSRPPAAIADGAPELRGPVITSIVGRHEIIIVRAGASEPTYSVESKDHVAITGEMTLGELAASNPELFSKIKSMQAPCWAGL